MFTKVNSLFLSKIITFSYVYVFIKCWYIVIFLNLLFLMHMFKKSFGDDSDPISCHQRQETTKTK